MAAMRDPMPRVYIYREREYGTGPGVTPVGASRLPPFFTRVLLLEDFYHTCIPIYEIITSPSQLIFGSNICWFWNSAAFK